MWLMVRGCQRVPRGLRVTFSQATVSRIDLPWLRHATTMASISVS
jgi:hypothetical protein